MEAAGIMYCAGSQVLLMKRRDDATNGGTWAFPAGKIEAGETPDIAAMREWNEETGTTLTVPIRRVSEQKFFTLYRADGDRFEPKICDEHSEYAWCNMDQLPSPLHPGLAEQMKDAMAEKNNALQLPQVLYARHMVQGIAGYENENILVDTDCLKRMAKTMNGKPIYVYHQEVKLESLESDIDGVVSDTFYNELDGWLWSKFTVHTDRAHKAVANGWSVSNAYMPTSWDDRGSHLNVDYTRKITNGEFTHLAIVPNPRYESAKIFTPEQFKMYQEGKRIELEELKNSNDKQGDFFMSIANKIGKIFKTEKVEVTNAIPADADLSQYHMDVNGKSVPLSEIIAAVQNSADDKKKDDEKENADPSPLTDDTVVTVGSDTMPLKDLMNKYNAVQKKNAEDDEEKKNKAKKNEVTVAEEQKNALEGKNHFEQLANAKPQVAIIDTSHDQLARGASRYSLTK